MEWNELKTRWQHQPAEARSALRRPEGLERLWQTVKRRDARETIVGLAMAGFFAVAGWHEAGEGNALAAAFALMLVAAMLFIPWHLRRARKLVPTPDPKAPVRAFLAQELAALQAQTHMLRTVSLWYTAPIAVGVLGFFGALSGFDWAFWVLVVFLAALARYVHRLNQKAVDEAFRPAAAAISQQLEALREEE